MHLSALRLSEPLLRASRSSRVAGVHRRSNDFAPHVPSRKWMIELLTSAAGSGELYLTYRYHFRERLPPPYVETDNYDVYAALWAAGCPRLASLLTDFDPRDPLDEAIAEWKLWVVAVERVESGGGGRLLQRPLGFLVPAEHLWRAGEGELEELRARAGGSRRAAAQLAVKAELERLFEQADAGFPNISKIFERYVEALNLLGRPLVFSVTNRIYPLEKLRDWADRGIGKLYQLAEGVWGLDIFIDTVNRTKQLPMELRKEWEKLLLDELKWLAGTLAPIYYSYLNGYVFAHEC